MRVVVLNGRRRKKKNMLYNDESTTLYNYNSITNSFSILASFPFDDFDGNKIVNVFLFTFYYTNSLFILRRNNRYTKVLHYKHYISILFKTRFSLRFHAR